LTGEKETGLVKF